MQRKCKSTLETSEISASLTDDVQC